MESRAFINEVNNEIELSSDWSQFEEEKVDVEHVDSVGDALVYSLRKCGKVDLEYMSLITGVDKDEIISSLKGSIYKDPKTTANKYDGYLTANEYLSGNLLAKLRIAEANNQNGLYDDNIEALNKIMPDGVSADEIYYSIASPWIPDELIETFYKEVILYKYYKERPDIGLNHNSYTGKWDITTNKSWISQSARLRFGTDKISAIEVFEHALNQKPISISSQYKDKYGDKYRMKDEEATALAEEKVIDINAEFKSFIEERADLYEKLSNAYNMRFGFIVSRVYDGSFLDFPNINRNIDLYDYQRNAIARIIFNPNTLLAHNVGTGKTYIMIAAGEELHRMGLSEKNLYVVPNNIVHQWERDYLKLYPNANILATKPDDYSPSKIQRTLGLIRDGGFTSIIMPHSSFDMIELSPSSEVKEIRGELTKIYNLPDADRTKEVEKRERKLKDRLNELDYYFKELEDPMVSNTEIFFDDLGITRLFVDEAHEYKNVPIKSALGGIKGLNLTGSTKCGHLKQVCGYLNAQPNTGIIMATGTPITNSVSDLFVLQSYLQNGELRLLDIDSFDKWLSMFANINKEIEIDVTTTTYKTTNRISKFHNLPELTEILANIADFYNNIDSPDLPKFNGYTDVVIKKTGELTNYILGLADRADNVRKHKKKTDGEKDNMLKITSDGRKAALDLRLIDNDAYHLDYTGKLSACANNVCDIYLKTKNFRGTQLIFCDTSVPGDDFNVYDELKSLLVKRGINPSEIAFVHDAKSPKARDSMFKKVSNGDIRILLGSTYKLGVGVNIQEKLYAIHHLDVPWRPSDMVQREGRILRQGNTNEEIFIYRYIVEGSFDAYSWQILETKQKFINELLSNSVNERQKEDIEDLVLNYSEVKALALGNSRLKDHVELTNELSRLRLLARKEKEKRANIQRELLEIPAKIMNAKNNIEKLEADINHYEVNKQVYSVEFRNELRSLIWSTLMNNLRGTEEVSIDTYHGFEIVAPKNLVENNLYLYIVGKGRHIITIGSSEFGSLNRIDNYLESGMADKLKENKKALKEFEAREAAIKEELNKTVSYDEEIEAVAQKVKELEKELKIIG